MTPEVEGVFLLDSEDEIEWFAQMGIEQGHESLDVWEVSLPVGAGVAESDEGYSYFPGPIPPEGIRLHIKDWVPRDPARVAGDLFHGIYYGDGSLKPDLLTENVVVIDVDGERRQGLDAVAEWARSRAHGSPPPPEPRSGPDGRFVIEISNDGGFSIEGLDDDRCLVSPAADGDFWTVVYVLDNLVTEVREFRSRVEALSGSDPPMAEA